jgi:hypothetical protein
MIVRRTVDMTNVAGLGPPMLTRLGAGTLAGLPLHRHINQNVPSFSLIFPFFFLFFIFSLSLYSTYLGL